MGFDKGNVLVFRKLRNFTRLAAAEAVMH